jgi:hypothetical protein
MPVAEYEKFVASEEKAERNKFSKKNSSVLGELWNTRSNSSVIFDMMDVPIAIYEYRKDKFELLRANLLFETRIMFEKENNDKEYKEKIKEQENLLSQSFAVLAKGERCGPVEYQLMDGNWYSILVKVVGTRGDTLIIMATFIDITKYKDKDLL